MIELHQIAQKYPLPAESKRYARFFIACMKPFESSLPMQAKAAITVARHYWIEGKADQNSLELHRVQCAAFWEDEDTVQDAMYRMVTFPLSDPIIGSAIDNLDWFTTFLERLNQKDSTWKSVMQEWFPT